mmetsp:Transcript_17115/g.39439  ORF Transcript_17115/g.39439 Transcript_17115/m.39439 type:complete len:298 (-) Transcript_17115:390-1283(-)
MLLLKLLLLLISSSLAEPDVFYTLYLASESDISRVRGIVSEQLSYLTSEQKLYVQTIGTPLHIDGLANATTTLLQHRSSGSEKLVLHALWKHCRNPKKASDTVVYIHSKGSFHPSEANDILRLFLTRGALSAECAAMPASCNICSSRMSPLPHPHVPGNMWSAKCDYVKKLIDPEEFPHIMKKVGKTAKEPGFCLGNGRYAAEHWINSHPDGSPCDLYPDPHYVWGYNGMPVGAFKKALEVAPRFDLATYYEKEHTCGKAGQSLDGRINEYGLLYKKKPPASWWGWAFYGYNHSKRA